MLERISSVTYKLQWPLNAKIHPVFHVSVLKPCVGDHPVPCLPLPLLQNDQGPVLTPQSILLSRGIPSNGQHVQQVLVQWNELI